MFKRSATPCAAALRCCHYVLSDHWLIHLVPWLSSQLGCITTENHLMEMGVKDRLSRLVTLREMCLLENGPHLGGIKSAVCVFVCLSGVCYITVSRCVLLGDEPCRLKRRSAVDNVCFCLGKWNPLASIFKSTQEQSTSGRFDSESNWEPSHSERLSQKRESHISTNSVFDIAHMIRPWWRVLCFCLHYNGFFWGQSVKWRCLSVVRILLVCVKLFHASKHVF